MLILIEGVDGSGKNTQSKLLSQKLVKCGYDTDVLSFPQYDKFFGKEISNYLNGGFGDISNVNPKLICLLYALDRKQSKDYLNYFCSSYNKYLVLDRYVQSNIAHQCAKLTNLQEQQELETWIEKLEFDIFSLPRTHINFFLDIPVEFSQQLIMKKEVRGYTDKKKDLHEADTDYMHRSRNYYLYMAKRDNWNIVQCIENNNLRSAEDINEEIFGIVKNNCILKSESVL